MRTTVTFTDDVAAAVERLRREKSIGMSEAINELVRKGLAVAEPSRRFEQQTHALGLRVDMTNVADAIESLDGPTAE